MSWPTDKQKFKVNGQSVSKIEWKQTDGRTDGGDCITSHANAVSKKRFDINFVEVIACYINAVQWTVASCCAAEALLRQLLSIIFGDP